MNWKLLPKNEFAATGFKDCGVTFDLTDGQISALYIHEAGEDGRLLRFTAESYGNKYIAAELCGPPLVKKYQFVGEVHGVPVKSKLFDDQYECETVRDNFASNASIDRNTLKIVPLELLAEDVEDIAAGSTDVPF